MKNNKYIRVGNRILNTTDIHCVKFGFRKTNVTGVDDLPTEQEIYDISFVFGFNNGDDDFNFNFEIESFADAVRIFYITYLAIITPNKEHILYENTILSTENIKSVELISEVVDLSYIQINYRDNNLKPILIHILNTKLDYGNDLTEVIGENKMSDILDLLNGKSVQERYKFKELSK